MAGKKSLVPVAKFYDIIKMSINFANAIALGRLLNF